MCYPSFMDKRKEVASFMARLYDRGLTTACGGNVSQRDGNLMYITPSSLDKAAIPPERIARVDIASGECLDSGVKLSIESGMHRKIYLVRDDVMAVVHSHPVHASLFSALEEKIETRLLAEPALLLGEVVTAPYALMGSPELADNVAHCVEEHNCILLENHGALTVGRTLLEAYERLEVLENAARMTLMTLSGVHPKPLCRERIDEIRRKF